MRTIFLFELKYRLRRPVTYIYLLLPFLLAFYAFAMGSVPIDDGQYYNAPAAIVRFSTVMSFFMMLLISGIMGLPLYRDIEYNTKEYYLSYPITKAGYYWGRYLGSFSLVFIMGLLVILGAFAGSTAGPVLSLTEAGKYGPHHLINYLQPFFIILFPNLFLASSLFFGLVAITRNVKVIYSSGVILLLAYLAARVYFDFTDNNSLSQLTDPFGYNSVRLITGIYSPAEKNTALIPMSGIFLANRLIWIITGAVLLFGTYLKFNFFNFFIDEKNKRRPKDQVLVTSEKNILLPFVKSNYSKPYVRKTLATLTRIELLNIKQDNFFWLIFISFTTFVGFAFWLGTQNYMVKDFPRTVALVNLFKNDFLPFIFVVLIFYTGEAIHREKLTQFSFLNDALPPPDWVFYASKVMSLFILAAFLAIVPIVVGISIQFLKGFTEFNFAIYFHNYFMFLLPKVTQMVMLAVMVHVLINNKFAGHAFGIAIWGLFTVGLPMFADLDYNLFLYSSTPFFNYSDMEGVGHMGNAVATFNGYWLFFGGLFLVLGYLFFVRGIIPSSSDRVNVAKQRITTQTLLLTVFLSAGFLYLGSVIYYNVSYLNNYLTDDEKVEQKVAYENKLKKYESLPLPSITKLQLKEDLFPEDQKAIVHGFIKLVNKTNLPIDRLFVDGEALTEYSIKQNGKELQYDADLIYERGTFNWFRPEKDTSNCRLYHLRQQLNPGDSTTLGLYSMISYVGFHNDLYGTDILHNGIFFNGGLPEFGYNKNKEVIDKEERSKYNLSVRKKELNSMDSLPTGKINTDIIVSTLENQVAIAPGRLQKQWIENGRNYFHYLQDDVGTFLPLAILLARYDVLKDSVQLDKGQNKIIEIYYHPKHKANLDKFLAAYKDGLKYYSRAYGNYFYDQIRLAETSNYGPGISVYPGLSTSAEYYGWNADFVKPNQLDYCYYITAKQLAEQWWRFNVIPNQMENSQLIPEGLSTFDALLMYEKKYGQNMREVLEKKMLDYIISSSRDKKNPLLNSNKRYDYDTKAGFVLYGLKDLIGEDSMNAALRQFSNKYKYTSQNTTSHAGSNDLFRVLQKHVPDSMQYYLEDTWKKITFYNNKIIDVSVKPSGKNNQYEVTLQVIVSKLYMDNSGNERPADSMNDYIDIGIFAADSANKEGLIISNPLFLKKYKLTAGKHKVHIVINGKPVRVGIDPYGKLIDKIQDDNVKGIQY